TPAEKIHRLQRDRDDGHARLAVRPAVQGGGVARKPATDLKEPAADHAGSDCRTHHAHGEIVTKKFYANYGGVDYVVEFCQSGAAYQVNLSNGAQVKFALAGTFTNPDMTQWQSSRILIADPTAGYSTWDGTVFVKPGGLSPNFTITAGGSGYSSGATVGFSGGSGSGAAGTVTVVGGVVTGIVLTNAGSGYHAGDTITV